MITQEQVLSTLKTQIEQISHLRELKPESIEFKEWIDFTFNFLCEAYGEKSRQTEAFRKISFSPSVIFEEDDINWTNSIEAYKEGLNDAESQLKSFVKIVELYGYNPFSLNRPQEKQLPGHPFRFEQNFNGPFAVSNSTSNASSESNMTLSQIVNQIDQLPIPNEEKLKAKTSLNNLQDEIGKQNPSSGKLKEIIDSISQNPLIANLLLPLIIELLKKVLRI